MPAALNLQLYLARLLQLVQQRERSQRNLPVNFSIPRFSHREVVREGNEGNPWRPDVALHGERDGGDAPLLYGVAYQPYGPVAQGS